MLSNFVFKFEKSLLCAILITLVCICSNVSIADDDIDYPDVFSANDGEYDESFWEDLVDLKARYKALVLEVELVKKNHRVSGVDKKEEADSDSGESSRGVVNTLEQAVSDTAITETDTAVSTETEEEERSYWDKQKSQNQDYWAKKRSQKSSKYKSNKKKKEEAAAAATAKAEEETSESK